MPINISKYMVCSFSRQVEEVQVNEVVLRDLKDPKDLLPPNK
jgi:hypothetical protein